MNRSIATSSLSLSQKLRTESSKELSKSVTFGNEAKSRQTQGKRTLPTIQSSKGSTSMNFPEPFEHFSPVRRNTVNRLSGLPDNVNSSGLFSDSHIPKTVSALCVRCGTLAALCMPCAEQDTEDALIFYRKTRAAGAATLFNKAFIEAGFRKALKFVVFRLLKNYCQMKTRERMKKKAIVEKLFGTNLVYLPFTAWRRYTKENIVHRKNKTIEQLNSQIELLETQIRKISANLTEVTRESDQLKKSIQQKDQTISQQKATIESLQADNHAQKQRVKGLSHLVIPLTNYSNAIQSITEQKIFETNRYLQKAATLTTSYNYSHLFSTTFFDALSMRIFESNQKKKDKNSTRLTNIGNLPSKQLQAAHSILLTWMHSISLSANEYLEPTSGQSINFYLPQHIPVDTLSDLRNGRLLSRVIICLIYDRILLRMNAEKGIVNLNASYYQLWPKGSISLEDLEKLQSLESHSLELLTFLIHLTSVYLEMPAFKPLDLYSGKSDVIYHFCVCLMNSSVPLMNKNEKDYFEKKISIYYQIVNELEDLRQEKTSILTTYFRDKETQDVPLHLLGLQEAEKPQHNAAAETIKQAIKEDDEDEEEAKTGKKNEEKKKKHEEEDDEDVPDDLTNASVEIRQKSVLDKIYDFFVEESYSKRHTLEEAQKKFEALDFFADPEHHKQPPTGHTHVEASVTITQTNSLSSPPPGLHSSTASHTHTADSLAVSRSASVDNVSLDGSLVSAASHAIEAAHHTNTQEIPPPSQVDEESENNVGIQHMKQQLQSMQSIPKLSYSLEMSEHSYEQLCKILDEFITSRESAQILEFSEKTFIISEKLAELQVAISLMRDHRDEGIRLTTDLRQFVLTQAMKVAVQQLRVMEANASKD